MPKYVDRNRDNNEGDNGVFIVAELSANHGNDIEIAKSTILKAKEIGCDAVKIQTLRPGGITMKCNKDCFVVSGGTIWDGSTLYDLYTKTHLPWEWHEALFDFARKNDIILFSSPFEYAAVDLLESCGNPVYKIASFEITDIPLIEYVAKKGKPMIISTGIATEKEISDAVEACRSVGNDDICLLKCTSAYPSQPEDAALNTMVDMKMRFGTDIGLSDHTIGGFVAEVAASMGASVIEKHFILDRNIGGPDASFSIEPDDFKIAIERIRMIEKIKGKVSYLQEGDESTGRKYARSLFVVKDVALGEALTEENVRSVRPSNGMKPKHLGRVLGMRFAADYEAGTPLKDDMIREGENE